MRPKLVPPWSGPSLSVPFGDDSSPEHLEWLARRAMHSNYAYGTPKLPMLQDEDTLQEALLLLCKYPTSNGVTEGAIVYRLRRDLYAHISTELDWARHRTTFQLPEHDIPEEFEWPDLDVVQFVRLALAQLSARHRKILLLFYVEQLSAEEITRIMHVNRSRIYMLRLSAVRKFAYRYEQLTKGTDYYLRSTYDHYYQ